MDRPNRKHFESELQEVSKLSSSMSTLHAKVQHHLSKAIGTLIKLRLGRLPRRCEINDSKATREHGVLAGMP